MSFGVLNPEKIRHQYLAHLLTSPVYCSLFTLGNPKKSFFNSIIHTYFRLFTLSQKKTNCYPLPTTPENVTTLPGKMQNFLIRRSAEIQPMSQDASATRSYLGLVLDTRALPVSKLAVPTSSSLSPEQKSTGSITETCC